MQAVTTMIDVFPPLSFEGSLLRFKEEYALDIGTVKACMNRIFHLDYSNEDYERFYTAVRRKRDAAIANLSKPLKAKKSPSAHKAHKK